MMGQSRGHAHMVHAQKATPVEADIQIFEIEIVSEIGIWRHDCNRRQFLIIIDDSRHSFNGRVLHSLRSFQRLDCKLVLDSNFALNFGPLALKIFVGFAKQTC